MGNAALKKSSKQQVGPTTTHHDRVVPISMETLSDYTRSGYETSVVLVVGSGKCGTPLFPSSTTQDDLETESYHHKDHDQLVLHTRKGLSIRLTQYACCIDNLPHLIFDARDTSSSWEYIYSFHDWIDKLPLKPHSIMFKTDLTNCYKTNLTTGINRMAESVEAFRYLYRYLLSTKRVLLIVLSLIKRNTFDKEQLQSSSSIIAADQEEVYPKSNYDISTSMPARDGGADYLANQFLACANSGCNCCCGDNLLSLLSCVESHDNNVNRSIDAFVREMDAVRLAKWLEITGFLNKNKLACKRCKKHP